jgi:hypothetical protein
MRFDTASSTPKITFKPLRFLEANEISTAIEQGKSPEAIKAITMTVAQEKSDAPKFEALVAPKATVVAEEATEAAEPTKRASKKEEPAPKKDLSKILSDWDDEE